MSEDLIRRLDIKAGVMEMGEKIAWGSDTALMREAQQCIGVLMQNQCWCAFNQGQEGCATTLPPISKPTLVYVKSILEKAMVDAQLRYVGRPDYEHLDYLEPLDEMIKAISAATQEQTK